MQGDLLHCCMHSWNARTVTVTVRHLYSLGYDKGVVASTPPDASPSFHVTQEGIAGPFDA